MLNHRPNACLKRIPPASFSPLAYLLTSIGLTLPAWANLSTSPVESRLYEELAKHPAIHRLMQDTDAHHLTQIISPQDTPLNTTKFQHYYKDIEVLGSMIIHHTSPKRSTLRNRLAEFNLNTNPTVSVSDALSLARAFSQSNEHELNIQELPALKILPNGTTHSAELIYWVRTTGSPTSQEAQDVLIDAHNGRIMAALPRQHSALPFHVYSGKMHRAKLIPYFMLLEDQGIQTGNQTVHHCLLTQNDPPKTETLAADECKRLYQGQFTQNLHPCQIINGLNGTPLLINTAACESPPLNEDVAARNAAENARKILNYYDSHFGRKSYDNHGSPLISVVHAGEQMANAFWNLDLKMMIYGDGDGISLNDFSTALDIAGHEETHGIIQNTAQLIMMGESGALSEGYADFFGKLIEAKNNWVMGDGLFINPQGPRGFRDLAHPASLSDQIADSSGHLIEKPYPTTKAEEALTEAPTPCDSNNDGCWVHYNSTIPSHAAYLVLQALGTEKAELLYYTVLTQSLTATETFESATQATVETCHHLRFPKNNCDSVVEIYRKLGFSIHSQD